MLRTVKRAGICVLAGILVAETVNSAALANAHAKKRSKTIVITLYPGHGGKETGATSNVSGKMVYEKKLNLSIAKYLKSDLEKYKNVKVYLTRSKDRFVTLENRSKIAKKHKSDLLFSIHNNAAGSAQSYKDGASALISKGQYRSSPAKKEAVLGKKVLRQINADTGIANRGLLKRTTSVYKYPNGTKADYYSIIRNGTKYNIPSMILEHSFIDSKRDAKKLNTAAKVKKLAGADAKAISDYYGLVKK